MGHVARRHPGHRIIAHIAQEANDLPAGQIATFNNAITVDPNQARACWFWMASDNFRLSAENAVAVMKEWI